MRVRGNMINDEITNSLIPFLTLFITSFLFTIKIIFRFVNSSVNIYKQRIITFVCNHVRSFVLAWTLNNRLHKEKEILKKRKKKNIGHINQTRLLDWSVYDVPFPYIRKLSPHMRRILNEYKYTRSLK